MPDSVPVVLFDDALGRLAPLTDLRPTYDVRTGALTLRERLARMPGVASVAARPRADLAALAAEDAAEDPADPQPPPDAQIVLLNGRCPLPPVSVLAPGPAGAWFEQDTGHLVAARCRAAEIDEVLAGRTPGDNVVTLPGHVLLRTAIDWRRFRDLCLDADLALLAPDVRASSVHEITAAPGSIAFGPHPIAIHPQARIYPGVILNAEDGPIVIQRGAVIRPGAILVGPVSIGPGSTVLEHALVKAHTALGPVCKVAGEVGGTIFQGHANKAHHGHLGDSWIGAWANLGAGTTNSNLLNTYADVPVQLEPGGGRLRSGERYLGCTVGDHAKFAINTTIMTGAVVHTGAMWAASKAVKDAVPRFAWVTDEGERSFRLDKFLDIARTVMARRDVRLSPAYEARLRTLHAA